MGVMERRRMQMLFGLVAVLVPAIIATLAMAAGTPQRRTILVSRANGTHGAKGDSFSERSATSANGRFVAFESNAANLSPADPDTTTDIYVRDLVRHRTILASRANGTHGAKSDDFSFSVSISASGRFVAFTSRGDNLSSADDNVVDNIFVRDLVKHRTILVSRRNGTHGGKANGFSSVPSISGDGRFVAFNGRSDNLSSADTSSDDDIYVRDLKRHRTILASRQNGTGGAKADGFSDKPSISGDGRFVAFESDADNLSSADDNSVNNIYVRDLPGHRTILASRRNGLHGGGSDGNAFEASISADGHSVAFESHADNMSPADTSNDSDVYVRRLPSHRTILVSRRNGAHGTKADGNITNQASISATGRFVAFSSNADNLSSADISYFPYKDIFVRDLVTNRTVLASRRTRTHGGKSHGDSIDPSIAAGAGAVAFTTNAPDLSPADGSTDDDIYLRTLR